VRITNFHGNDALAAIDATANKYYANATITGATADPGGTVTVNFTVKNAAGQPVSGLRGMQFNIAKLVPASGNESFNKWVPYLWRKETVSGSADGGTWPNPDGTTANQGSRENNGTITDNGDGSYTYVFAKNISALTQPVGGAAIAYERNLTHRVSLMMGGSTGATATAHFDFVPDGTAMTETRDIVPTSACKTCHGDRFAAHGGDRLTVENCATCHVPGANDAQGGETLDLKVMIHKIHAGSELPGIAGPDGEVFDDPTTPQDETADNGTYAIWGFQNTKHTWWKVTFPAVLANCQKCHTGSGANADNWKNVPSRDACGSCHADVDFTTGVNHIGGPVSSDAACTGCHQPSTASFAPSIVDSHDFMTKDPRNTPEYIPEMSVSAPANGQYFVAGERPVVTIKLRDAEKDGTPYIDHTTVVADDSVTAVPPWPGAPMGNGAEGCPQPDLPASYRACPPKDGKFTSANFFVHGPRARRNPVLTTIARVVVKGTSTATGTFDLSAGKPPTLDVKIDNGWDVMTTDATGGDIALKGSVSVPLFASAVTGEAATWGAGGNTFTDANQAFLSTGRTWRDHQFAGWTITLTDTTVSPNVTKTFTVLDNVGTTVTLDGVASTAVPDGGPGLTLSHAVTYSMLTQASTYSGSVTSLPDATSVADANAAWVDHQFVGYTFKVVSGTGASQTASVVDNAGTVLTLAWPGTPPALDSTSVYMLQPFADLKKATNAEIVNWLNANAAFKARAIAYLDEYMSVINPGGNGLAQAGTKFTVTLGMGGAFPAAGQVVIDKGVAGKEETLAYTRAGDAFTLAVGAANAHAAGATVRVPSVAIRSRNLGRVFSIAFTAPAVTTIVDQVFPGEKTGNYPVHMIGSNTPGATNTTGTASTASNRLAQQTDPSKNDPKVSWSTDAITYTLDPVDDLAPGTYIAKIEMADRGTVVTAVNYKTPTVARIKFQVKSAVEELAPATNCGLCHTSGVDDPAQQNNGAPESERGMVFDPTRHHKVFNNTAVDLCGNCHDLQPQNSTGDWSGAVAISRRVHAVHRGAHLTYPNTTVAHPDEPAGRNWDIEFPQDIRTCDSTCHVSTGPNATSGTWKTKPARVPCGGCHDSDANHAHFKAMTYDPTPNAPYSGDEEESCSNCH
jgi:hypothetical protein